LTLAEAGTYTDQMKKPPMLVLASVALMAAASAPVGGQAIQRSLYVSVLDSSSRVVPGLGPSEFVVREDNVAREVLKVAPAAEPMQIALLVDDSHAATDLITDYREGLRAFLTTIGADANVSGRHSVALVTLGARPTIRVDYTTNQQALLDGAGRLFAQSDSAACLLDGIFEVSEGISRREPKRPVIVAITTEGPEVSNRSYLQVLDALGDSGAALHVIAVGTRVNLDIERSRVIDEGTARSGGSYDNLLSSRGLGGRLTQLATELTHQYLVTYAHPDSLIPPDKVTVSATRSGLTARGTLVRDEIEARR
jgi:hypothetical protein